MLFNLAEHSRPHRTGPPSHQKPRGRHQGEALIFKSLNIQLTEQATHFSQVSPGVDYRKAIQLLEKATAPVGLDSARTEKSL